MVKALKFSGEQALPSGEKSLGTELDFQKVQNLLFGEIIGRKLRGLVLKMKFYLSLN
ncbi:hypothetical protein [uncultured Amphritea sp.]|uniref:hypothetical protein n=1 Tax=uncultured Amphritea sp. TaxID=981605 RepID=UPI00262E22CF|nr:hypothetical protein [uncultured Amphritea sp.]